MIKILTITWSYDDFFDIKKTFLYQSMIKNNSPSNFLHIHYNRNNYSELEKIFNNNFGFQYEYILYKIYLTKNKIQDFNCEYIIFCDANDTVCLGNINNIIPKNNILFSSEINQYPSSLGDFEGLNYSIEDQKNKKFLNSGLFFCSTKQYYELLDSVITNILNKNIKSFGGDQGVYTYHYLSYKEPRIILDSDCELFFCSFSKHYENFINYKFPIFVHDNGWNWGSPRFIEKFNLV